MKFLIPNSGTSRPASKRLPAAALTERQQRGVWGENLALDYLLKAGLQCIARNLRYPAGEIDLLLRDGATLVFVEVRARRSKAWGGAAASVGFKKQRNLTIAAQIYLQTHYADRLPACRFDVIVIEGTGQIEWLKNAF